MCVRLGITLYLSQSVEYVFHYGRSEDDDEKSERSCSWPYVHRTSIEYRNTFAHVVPMGVRGCWPLLGLVVLEGSC